MGNENESGQSVGRSLPPPHPKKLKVLTTAAIFFGNVVLGFVMNAINPALEHIRSKYHTDIETVSVVFTIQLVSYCVGAIIFGFVSRFVKRQIIIMVALTGMAFSLYMVPHCPTLTVLFVVDAILGISCGAWDASQIVWIIEIWQEKAAPFILAQHFFSAFGCIIPSLVIAPFLSNNTETGDSGSGESKIYIPFTILGAVNTVALLFQVLLFVFCRYYTPPMYAGEKSKELTRTNDSSLLKEEQKLSEEKIDPANDSKFILGISRSRLQLIGITGVFLGAYQGMEICSMQFVPIFGQYSDLNMTETAAAYVLSGLTGMFALGRFVGIVLVLKMRLEVILCVNFALVVIANLILLIWATENLTLFWIGCMLLGLGYSTMYPAFCAFIEKHLLFTNAVGSFICVSGSIFSAVYPLIVGRLIERRAIVLTYTNFFSTVVCILTITWGYLLVRKGRTRV